MSPSSVAAQSFLFYFIELFDKDEEKKWFPLEAFGLTTFPFRQLEIKEIRS
jgi:hypothetical protein